MSNLYQRIMFTYGVLNPDQKINFDVVGSISSTKDMKAGKIDFSISDVSLDSADYISDRDLQNFPTMVAALAFYHNLDSTRSLGQDLVLSRQVITDIYLGNICSWNHPALGALNPDISLPNNLITLYVWKENEAINQIISQALSLFSEKFSQTIGNSTSPDWCANSNITSSFTRRKGRLTYQCQICCGISGAGCCRTVCKVPGLSMVQVVSADKFSIGYSIYDPSSTAYAQIASMINKAGTVVTPSSTSLYYATMNLNSLLDSKYNTNTLDCMSVYGWPLTTYSYLVLQKTTQISTCEARIAVVKFWYWFYKTNSVRQEITDAGLSPVPLSLVEVLSNALVLNTMCVVPGPNNSQQLVVAAPQLIELLTISFPISDAMPPVFESVIEAFNVLMESSLFYRLSYTLANSTLVFARQSGGFISPYIIEELSNPSALNSLFGAPFMLEAVVPVYTIPNLNHSLNLTMQLLADIFTCKITTWDNLSLVAYNPALVLLFNKPKNITLMSSTQRSDSRATLLRYLSANVDNFVPDKFLHCSNSLVFESDILAATQAELTDGAFTFSTLTLADSLNLQKVSLISKQPDSSIVLIVPSNETLSNCLTSPDLIVSFRTSSFLSVSLPTVEFGGSLCWPLTIVVYCFVPTQWTSDGWFGCKLAHEVGAFTSWLYKEPVVKQIMQSSVILMPDVLRKRALLLLQQHLNCGEDFFLQNFPVCTAKDYEFSISSCQLDLHNGEQGVVVTYYLSNNTNCHGGTPMPPNVHADCDHILLESAYGAAVSLFAYAGLLFWLIVALYKIWDWKFFFEKVQLPRCGMNEITCLFGVCINILVVALQIGPITDSTCHVQPWLFFGIPDTIYAIYLSKVKVGHDLFKQKGITKVKVTYQRILKGVALMIVPEWILLIVWSAFSSPVRTTILDKTLGLIPQNVCSSKNDGMFILVVTVYKSIWLIKGLGITVTTLVGTNLAFQMWNMKKNQGETRFIAIGMFVYFMCTAVILTFTEDYTSPFSGLLLSAGAVLVFSNVNFLIMGWLYWKSTPRAQKSSPVDLNAPPASKTSDDILAGEAPQHPTRPESRRKPKIPFHKIRVRRIEIRPQ